ncbi:MAG: ATP-binding cassette domain-containing protein [Anaerolineaceae bacterium]|nr:ATP-binding cassette domain-containing protein [Anaerolineaceae bacterium]
MTSNFSVEVKGLKKSFGNVQAVNGADFHILNGEIFSLLGPNGAGKTTSISMICGLITPDEGDAFIMGHSIRSDATAARAALGVVPQDIALYPDLSARENLNFWGKMYGLRGSLLKQRVDEVLEMIDLTDRQKGRVGTFSGGMKRRVNIGAALLHHPQVIFMDEPTVGIDPQSRRHILDNVKALNKEGMSVLYTTHYMEEAQELSDHIAIMDHGKMMAYGTHAELIRLVGEQTRIELQLTGNSIATQEAWKLVDGVKGIAVEDGHVTTLVEDSNVVLPRLFDAALKAGSRITGVEIREPNLESVFMHLTGRALRD